MNKRFEYRLRWQLLGLRPTSRIMQTERAVVEKAERMIALDVRESVHVGDDIPW